jgi:putative DNA modification/repair radical SAM protein
VSINLEMPTEASLKQLAPEKNHADIIRPMKFLSEGITVAAKEKALVRSAPKFAPAGQSTQIVIGATPETDLDVMRVADTLYKKYALKRVYYSGYVPISNDSRLPQMGTPVPLIRENRLYQADWLLRFYKFSIQELIEPGRPHLDLDIDPKLSWALRNPQCFPVDVNHASYQMILRVPGIGVGSAIKIVKARKFKKLGWEELKRFGMALSRASHFIVYNGMERMPRDIDPAALRERVLGQSKYGKTITTQQSLFT